jgi:hypothetical protein
MIQYHTSAHVRNISGCWPNLIGMDISVAHYLTAGLVSCSIILCNPVGCSVDLLKFVGKQSVSVPSDVVSLTYYNFVLLVWTFFYHQLVNERLRNSHIRERIKKMESGDNIDWATAEALAMGTLLHQGMCVAMRALLHQGMCVAMGAHLHQGMCVAMGTPASGYVCSNGNTPASGYVCSNGSTPASRYVTHSWLH